MEKPPATGSLPDFLQREVDALLQPALMRGLVKVDDNGEYQLADIKSTAVIDTTDDTGKKVDEVLEK